MEAQSVKREAVDALRAAGYAMTPAELAEILGEPRNTAKQRLWRMAAEGVLQKDADGRYSVR